MDILVYLRSTFCTLCFTVIICVFLSLFPTYKASADIALLVHGFDSNASTWQHSGISQSLHQKGWDYKGVLIAGNINTVKFLPISTGIPTDLLMLVAKTFPHHKLYNANLASRAPLEIQAQQLIAIIHWLNKAHPYEPVYLVGHSLGGLVARYAVVQMFLRPIENPITNPIAALITIASPHLGTIRAVEAIDDAYDTPSFCPGPGWDFMLDAFGGYEYDLVRDSEILLYELFPSRPNNLLFWLNRQPHPEIPYFSVVRSSAHGLGDAIVPGYSQDINNIPALKGHSITLFSDSGHFLNPYDSIIIYELLDILTSTKF